MLQSRTVVMLPKLTKAQMIPPPHFMHPPTHAHRPQWAATVQGASSSPKLEGLIPDAKAFAGPHTLFHLARGMWFNISMTDSSYCVNVASCPRSNALADLPSCWAVVSLTCTWWGGKRGKGSWETFVSFLVWLKSWWGSLFVCFQENQFQHLGRGTSQLFCLRNQHDLKFSIKLQLMCFQASVGLFLSSKFSSWQLIPRTECFQMRG